MAKSGYELYADLDRLKAVGSVELPNMALAYSTLNHKTAATSDVDHAAFNYDEWGMDCVYGAWSELRDKLQNAFGKCRNRYEDAGRALVHIVNAYEGVDSEAADDMHEAGHWGKDGQHVPKTYHTKGDLPVDGEIPPARFAK